MYGKRPPEKLDIDWYIHEARARIHDFIGDRDLVQELVGESPYGII
jgi:hypothetical protein